MTLSSIALTVDVEEWHHGLGLPARTPSVVEDTGWLLDAFQQHGVRGTFFVLGEVASQHPKLVQRIANEGHEVGFHGALHTDLSTLSPERFREELKEWLPRLQDVTGQPIYGYRAPYFSLTRETSWALPLLVEAGIKYDASLYPGLHDRIGWPGGPKQPVLYSDTELVIFPVPVLPGIPLGFSGGGWLRVLPMPLVRWALGQYDINMVYVHPYEVSLNPPIPVGAEIRGRIVRRLGKGQIRRRLLSLLKDYGGAMQPMNQIVTGLHSLSRWETD